MAFFTEIESLKIQMKPQKPPKAKIILSKKKKAGVIALPGFKATVTKRVWYWQKVRHTGQWNIIESPEINPHIYGQLIFDKGARERETNTTLSHLCVESK